MVSKKSNVTVDSKHQEKMNEFKHIEEIVLVKSLHDFDTMLSGIQ